MKKLLQSLVVLLLVAGSALAQDRTITGVITAKEDGLPIPGVTVKQNGTNNGTSTNSNGQYSLKVPAGTSIQLVYSAIGFSTMSKTLASGVTKLNIVLENDSRLLDEVVVAGYGSARRISSTVGSITTVTAKTIENKPVANAFDALQGKVAGLQVFTSSGEPSSSSSLRLHGVGSLGASNTPLYLLDGIQVDGGSIVSLNPNDIASISVLKDASSTSIYGSRAANGVVYITTKKGQIGKSAISIQSQYSVSNNAHDNFYRNFLNTAQLSKLQVEQGLRTQAQTDALLTKYPNDFKWYDYYYKKDAPVYQTDLTVSGGAGKTTYYISGSYFKSDGIAFRSEFDRFTFRSNIDTRINDYIRFGLNLSAGTDNRQANPYTFNSTNGGLALLAQPWYSPYDANGNEYIGQLIPGWGRYSPRYLANSNPFNANNIQFNPTGYIEVKPIKNLIFRSQGGMDGNIIRSTFGRLPSFVGALGAGTLNEQYARRILKTWTNTLEYRFSFAQHNFTALAGQEYVDGTTGSFSGGTVGLPTDDLFLLQNGTATNRDVNSNKTEYAYKSLFGRLEYNFKNRYFIDGSVRQDKSSRFGAAKQSATFYSVGAMWKLKQESFLKDVKWIDDISLRASTGTSGNSEIGNYESLATASASGNYNGQFGLTNSAPGNSQLGWERQQKTSVGVKTSFLDRIRLDLEYYYRTTSSQLINVPQVFTTGYANVRTNVGALQNKGLDVTLDFDILRRDAPHGAYITPYFNANFNRNKITELFQGKNYYILPNTGVLWAIGQPVSFVYPIWKGVDPSNGLPQWYVPNTGDGVINTRKDEAAITNSFSSAGLNQNTGLERYPWLNGGFGFNAGYENFYTSVDFTFSQGKNLTNNDRYFFENPTTFVGFNQSTTVLDYWKTPGQIATFPALSQQFTQFDSRLIEDASFIRLKSLQVGYTFKSSLLEKTKVINGAKIFFLARNLLTFTHYSGPDPEVDTNVTLGVNPNTKQVGFGLQLTF